MEPLAGTGPSRAHRASIHLTWMHTVMGERRVHVEKDELFWLVGYQVCATVVLPRPGEAAS